LLPRLTKVFLEHKTPIVFAGSVECARNLAKWWLRGIVEAPPLEMSRASLTQAWGSGLGKQYEISLSEYLERCEAGLEYWNGRQIVIKSC